MLRRPTRLGRLGRGEEGRDVFLLQLAVVHERKQDERKFNEVFLDVPGCSWIFQKAGCSWKVENPWGVLAAVFFFRSNLEEFNEGVGHRS